MAIKISTLYTLQYWEWTFFKSQTFIICLAEGCTFCAKLATCLGLGVQIGSNLYFITGRWCFCGMFRSNVQLNILYHACNWCSLLNNSRKGLAKIKLTNFNDIYWKFWKPNSQSYGTLSILPTTTLLIYMQNTRCILGTCSQRLKLWNIQFEIRTLLFWNKSFDKYCWFLVTSLIFHMLFTCHFQESIMNPTYGCDKSMCTINAKM
jgi:hypothetical protein